jgi:hypothetical protein
MLAPFLKGAYQLKRTSQLIIGAETVMHPGRLSMTIVVEAQDE